MAMMLIAAAALLLVSIGGASRLDAGSAAGAAGGAASGAAGAAGDAASGAAGAAGSAASGAAGAAGSAASGAAGAAGDAASGAAGAAGSAASGAVGAAGNAASGAAGAAGSAASGAAGAAGNAASGVLGGAARGSAGSASIGPGNAPTASIAAPTDEVGARAVASLPAGLLPIEAGGGTIGPWVAYVPELGQVHGTKEALSGLARVLRTIPGTPLSAIRACRDRIASLSQPYGAIRVEAAGAGPIAQRRRGLTEAAIWARILYRRAGLTQVRQARVTCQLDARGQVLAVRSGLTS